jgi:TolB protein
MRPTKIDARAHPCGDVLPIHRIFQRLSMRKASIRIILALIATLLAPAIARAALTIEIIGAGANQIPIAIVPFRAENGLSQQITPVIAADLTRSGLFRTVDAGGVNPLPTEPAEVNFGTWNARGAEALVIGNVIAQPDGRYEIRFRLMDAVKQTQLAGFAYTATAAQLRLTAHKIADVIYEKLTGDPGVFSTRITYVVKRGTRYELHVADADGYNAQSVLGSNEPIISPTWSPDGTRIAYVSFEDRKPVVYVQSLVTGGRQAVANFRGSNSAPAWSPDGRRLAVVLTRDGNSQIYIISADGSGTPTRVSNSSAIDTEPSFSPDGQLLLFTSDRGGSPQVYGMPASGGQARRLTFEGNYNVSPRFSPDGKSFAFVQRNGSRFNIAIQDLTSRQVQLLTDGSIDESPSFAPNGRMILYASRVGGRGILAAVSSDGRVRQRLTETAGDVREPAWGPLVK